VQCCAAAAERHIFCISQPLQCGSRRLQGAALQVLHILQQPMLLLLDSKVAALAQARFRVVAVTVLKLVCFTLFCRIRTSTS
jgi:hypothetical protein